MYYFFSPTGAGLTSDSALADRMRQLRDEYIEAFQSRNEEAKKRILEEENTLIEKVRNEEPIVSQELKDCAEMIRRMGKILSFEENSS